MKKHILVSAACALALFGFGCAKPTEPTKPAQPSATEPSMDSDSRKQTVTVIGGDKPTTTPTTKPTPKPAAKPINTVSEHKTVTVVITGMKFSPQVIAANTGDTVVWVNKDTVAHTTHSDGALLWDSGNLAPGKSFSHTFNGAGSYKYSSGIYPSMTGTVVITDKPAK